jgi:hypothetical protein
MGGGRRRGWDPGPPSQRLLALSVLTALFRKAHRSRQHSTSTSSSTPTAKLVSSPAPVQPRKAVTYGPPALNSITRSLLPFGPLHQWAVSATLPPRSDGASLLADPNFRPSPNSHRAPEPDDLIISPLASTSTREAVADGPLGFNSITRSLLPFGTLYSVPSRQPYPQDQDGASLKADLNFRPSPTIYPAPSPTTSSFLPSLQHPPAKPSPTVPWGSTPSLDHYCLSAYCISGPSRQPYPHDQDGASLLADPNFRPSPTFYPAPSPTTSSFLPSLQHPPAKPSPTAPWGSTPSLDHYCLSAYCISGPSRQPYHYDHDGASLLADLSFRLSLNSLIIPSLPSHQALSSPVQPSASSLHTPERGDHRAAA